MVRRWHVFGAAVAVLSLAAGCGGGAGGAAPPPPTDEPPTTTTEPAPPPSSVASEEDAVLAAYQGYWDTWLVANDPPNPNHPDLERFASGAALARDKEVISHNRSVGERYRLPLNSVSQHRAVVVEMGDGIARISDCSIDDGIVVAHGSEFVLDDSITTFVWEATLVFEDGWKVSELHMVEQSEGVSGCAV